MATTTEPAVATFAYVPDFPVPANVGVLQTMRSCGVSAAPWASFNVGTHVGDDPAHVAANRERLRSLLPGEPVWLDQVHGTTVADADATEGVPEADAAVARTAGRVCVVMTADCLPLLLCDRSGSVVAAAHAGWRGLCSGVVEAAMASMRVPASEILAWLGPAIGPSAFEVGDEVRAAFLGRDPSAAAAFRGRGDKWLADLYALARQRLAQAGVADVYGGECCTALQSENFYSYRRDGVTGRMASLIWRRV